MKRILSVFAALCLMSSIPAAAQKFSISTNVLDYACLGTLNMDASYSLSRRWSLTLGMKYNPFTYNSGDPDRQFQYRQQTYSVGARLWPWHTLSGWWFASRLKYQEYNAGGIWSRETEEGDRVGAGLYSGYTHMLSKHFNIEFGFGFWSGMAFYDRYSCPLCGLTVQSGRKYFILPDELMISIAYVF